MAPRLLDTRSAQSLRQATDSSVMKAQILQPLSKVNIDYRVADSVCRFASARVAMW